MKQILAVTQSYTWAGEKERKNNKRTTTIILQDLDLYSRYFTVKSKTLFVVSTSLGRRKRKKK